MSTPTPRTDAAVIVSPSKNKCRVTGEKPRPVTWYKDKVVPYSFACQLERELEQIRTERDALDAEKGDWVPGAKCEKCGGHGEDDEARSCQHCGGTGGIWLTWKERAEQAEAKLAEAESKIEVLLKADRESALAHREKDARLAQFEGAQEKTPDYTASNGRDWYDLEVDPGSRIFVVPPTRQEGGAR